MRCKCHNLSKLYKYTHTQFSCDNLSVASVVILMLTVCILFLVPYHPAAAQTVHIPDPGLRVVIEAALGKEAGADITQSDMESLESLQARCRYLTLSEKGWFTPLAEHWVCETTDDTFVSSIKNLTGLEFATNLIELEFGKNQISDVTPLKNLTKLTHLSLGINQISDVTPLKNLTKLTHLSLGINQISDVTPLKNLTNLIELDLLSNRISDVTPLKNLTKLTYLSLRDNQISDVTPLKDMTKLIYLSLRDNRILDVSPLKNLVKLTYLNLDHNYYKIDVSPFKNLINLRYLSLDDNQISDATPLKNLTKLIHLDISDNPILDLTPLKDMKKMIDLDLDSNGILDISPLKHLTNLLILDLAHNKISDISALKPLTKLRKLELDDNTISDLTPLKDMTNLFLLELDNNRISDVTSLKNLAKLTVLDLSHNHISDFSPITDLIDNLIEYDFSNQTEPPFSFADVNRDNTVNLADLVAIASNFADPDLEALARMNIYPDVNGDGLVNLIDLLIAASEIDAAAAAPTLSKNQIEKYNLTAKDLAAWIRLAKQLNLTEPNLQQGIDVLEQLLAILSTQDRLPKNTTLLPNYPNPFNPETWIPYQLAKTSDVSISIHSADGKLVRSLELGQLPAGVYKHKSRAAYWDGRNELGESVASGVYFYTLTANDFKATGKMFIQK